MHDTRRKFCAVNLAVRSRAGEGSLDRRHRLAVVELVNDRVGVVDGRTHLRKPC